ncbi:MAG: sugar kinase [Streptosporangiales bacterium]|nr:sugar kinase [Streptosporangiales bacterium]
MTSRGVLTVGEAMAVVRSEHPLRLGGPTHLTVAGAEANVAIGLARLRHPVRWFSRLGQDEPGALVARTLRAEGVDLTTVQYDDAAPTGLMLTDRLPGRNVRVHYYRSDSAASRMSPDDVTPELFDDASLLHLTGITPALGPGPAGLTQRLAEVAANHRVTVVLDVNHRARLWNRHEARTALRSLLPYIDVIVASEDELSLVTEGDDETAMVERLLDGATHELAVKRARRGASLFTPDSRYDHPAPPVDVLDTTGAGDAFCAGYLSATLDGLGPQERLARAVTLSACAVTAVGDWENLPTRNELDLLGLEAGETVR